jgi:CheY-like chemotaxis protein
MNETNKKRVLIVDDNPYILKLLTMMLELENLEVKTANDGSDALNLIINESEERFDIVITDYQMPIIDGQEFAETLKKYDEYKNIPIILVTQATHIRYENDNKYSVFDKILHKPVTKEALVEIMNTL